jgi:hypothetical protein
MKAERISDFIRILYHVIYIKDGFKTAQKLWSLEGNGPLSSSLFAIAAFAKTRRVSQGLAAVD